jgi:hypothetical protein
MWTTTRLPALATADTESMLEPFDSGSEAIVYRIDTNDDIVSVNDAWRSFAHANGAPTVADEIVGSSIWECIDGPETVLLWRDLIARVRQGATLSIPYRCDAPGRRRCLRMHLERLHDGSVEFASTLAYAEDRDPVELLAAHYELGEPIRCCSWCRRADAGGFVEVEEAIVRLGLLEQESRQITHVICDECAAVVLAAEDLSHVAA